MNKSRLKNGNKNTKFSTSDRNNDTESSISVL